MIHTKLELNLTTEVERQSSTAQLSTKCQCVCPCCTISGPPNQPMNVRDSKQAHSYHSEELKKKKVRLTVDPFRLVGTKSFLGYQCVLYVTKFFDMLVNQQSMKAYLCFQSAR